jgi:predicted phosphodiesterase
MKICVWSDLHLEFWDKDPTWKNPGADVLVLAGDICIADNLYSNPTAGLDDLIQNGFYANDARRYRKFFDHVSKSFPIVLYVMGNHEHYKGRWDRTESILRNEFSRYSNIHLLEQNKFVIDDVVFLGASIWSSFNNGDPLTLLKVKELMTDYKAITECNGKIYHKLRPITTFNKHRETVDWLNTMLKEDTRTTVVMGHHAPSIQSIHERYCGQDDMNSAFASNLEHLMFDHVKYWIHGHVHDPHNYKIGSTNILCNPFGYPGEPSQLEFNPELVVKI